MVSMALILFLLLLLLIYNGNCFYKDNLRHCSCCHRYLDKQNKTYQRLHENRVHMDFSLKGCHIFNAIYHNIDTVYPVWPPMFCYYIFDTKQLISLRTQEGISWWFMPKMKQLFQIQELHSVTCFFEDHDDKTYANIFAIYLDKNLYPCLCLVLFWVTISSNLE